MSDQEAMGRLSKAFMQAFYKGTDKWLSPANNPGRFAHFQFNNNRSPQEICHALRQLHLNKTKDSVSLTIEDIEFKVYGGNAATHIQPLLVAIPFPDMIYVPGKKEYLHCLPDSNPKRYEPHEKPMWNIANHRNGQTVLEVELPFPMIPPHVSLIVLTGYLCHHYLGGEMFPVWRQSAIQIEGVF